MDEENHPLLSAKVLAMLAILGLCVGLGVALILDGRLAFLGVLLGFVSTLAIFWLYWKPLHAAFETGSWKVPSMPSVPELVIAGICAAGSPGLLAYLYFDQNHPTVSSPPKPPVTTAAITSTDELATKLASKLAGQIKSAPGDTTGQAQLAELTKLRGFLGLGDNSLEAYFDFGPMLVLNINVQAYRIQWYKNGNTGPYPYPMPALLTVTKKGIRTVRGPIFPSENIGPNGANVIEQPNDIFFQPETAQYLAANKQLDDYLISPLVPHDVKVSLLALKQAVNDNISFMRLVMEKRKREDDRYFTEAFSPGSRFQGVVTGDFFFSKKRPRLYVSATAAMTKIQKYLKTN